jgi:DNA-binding XRE family transcriptional regulator
MAKSGLGEPPKSQPAQRNRAVRALSLPKRAQAELDRLLPHPPADVPLPEVLAKGERAREDFQVIFGNNLRASRLKCGLKQSEVAERTGLTQQYLSLIEAGQQNITLKTMILLAEVVDNDVADMLRKAADLPPKA